MVLSVSVDERRYEWSSVPNQPLIPGLTSPTRNLRFPGVSRPRSTRHVLIVSKSYRDECHVPCDDPYSYGECCARREAARSSMSVMAGNRRFDAQPRRAIEIHLVRSMRAWIAWKL